MAEENKNIRDKLLELEKQTVRVDLLTFQLGDWIKVQLPSVDTEEAWEMAKKMMAIYFGETSTNADKTFRSEQ